MRALMVDPGSPAGLTLKDVPGLVPGNDQVLVDVHAISLNRGELLMLASGGLSTHVVPDWDAAGVVVRAAATGHGPSIGDRVITFGWSGAWAQRRAVDLGELAVFPTEVDTGAASALPVAGVTALRAVRALSAGLGGLTGKTVLVTGASGGVGGYAVQLADQAGARVIAAVGTAARAGDLARLGADQVTIGTDGISDPVNGVLETVGGDTLARAVDLLADRGVLLLVGAASGHSASLPASPGRTIRSFEMGGGLGDDLAHLVQLVARGRLDPRIGWRGDWTGIAEAIARLRNRTIIGKAVLDTGPTDEQWQLRRM